MKIALTGSTGLVGSHLEPLLSEAGHEIVKLVRCDPREDRNEVRWDPAGRRIDATILEGVQAIVHLAGENIASGRWTSNRKKRIEDSRVQSTRLLAKTIAETLDPAPQVFVCASAIGFYGDRGAERLCEDSSCGEGFLADVCRRWEEETLRVSKKGIRVVNLRFGVILSPEGGALAKMLPPFRFGLGGRLGDGNQSMSWISIHDAVAAIGHVLEDASLSGPINVVAPRPVTNLEFTRTLGRVLGRPTLFPMPAFVVRAIFGQMGEELLLAGQRVEPARLMESGFKYRHEDLEGALRDLLGK